MNTISGKIMLKESGVGIPDLLVSVYDVGDGAQVETIRTAVISDGHSASVARQALGTV
jgi:hypothetical protein